MFNLKAASQVYPFEFVELLQFDEDNSGCFLEHPVPDHLNCKQHDDNGEFHLLSSLAVMHWEEAKEKSIVCYDRGFNARYSINTEYNVLSLYVKDKDSRYLVLLYTKNKTEKNIDERFIYDVKRALFLDDSRDC